MYQSHAPAGWDSYGSLDVEVLQFTDRAQVAGRLIDADHYRGTRAQFAALIGRPHRRKERHQMDQLPATPLPADPDSDPRSWPQRNYDVGFDPAGGGKVASRSASGCRTGAAAPWMPPGLSESGVVDQR